MPQSDSMRILSSIVILLISLHSPVIQGLEETKIVGGSATRPFQYPFMVFLMAGNSNCGASLIHHSWVVTAAHCIFGENPKSFKLLFHRHNVDFTPKEEGTISRKVTTIMIGQRYGANGSNQDDIALLKLDSPITEFEPVAFDTSGIYNDRNDTPALIMGWGAIQSGGPQSTFLREAWVEVISIETCQAIYETIGGIVNETIIIESENHICALSEEGSIDSCQGDSGGPILVREELSGKLLQIGVVSFGFDCGIQGVPGVYTSLYSYNDIIETMIQGTYVDFCDLASPCDRGQFCMNRPVGFACSQGSSLLPSWLFLSISLLSLLPFLKVF